MSPAQLLEQVEEKVRAFEREMRLNEFVDLPLARELAARSRALLALRDLPPQERRIVQAAIRYFIIADDAEGDSGIGGLDNDDTVMTAVMDHLGVRAQTRVA
jgi:hypothetical protein